MKTILNVKNLTKNFGGLCAVSNVSMTINEGELIGLIGPNGAGKTTLFNLLTGVYEPSSGLIELMDQDKSCLLYTSPSPRDPKTSRMPSSA